MYEQEQSQKIQGRIIPQLLPCTRLYLDNMFRFGPCATRKITKWSKPRLVLPGWLGLEHWPGEENLGKLSISTWKRNTSGDNIKQSPGAYRNSMKTELSSSVSCGNRERESRHKLKQENAKQVI